MSQQCTSCSAKDAIIQAQQKKLLRLQRIVQRAQAACVTVASNADQVLSQHQPRGTWSFARGARQAAQAIVKYLG